MIKRNVGKIKIINKQAVGNVTGLTMIEFVSLPANSRLSISYVGEPDSEGFMGLRKL